MEKTIIAEDKKFTKKYSFVLAFILGMAIMVVIYIVFEATTSPDNRVRTVVGPVDVSVDVSGFVQVSAEIEAPQAPSAFLGVEVMSVNSVIAAQLNIGSQTGVLVNSVMPNSPAKDAGLLRGDAIISVNNQTVKDVDSFKSIMADFEPLDKVRIIYIRNGKRDSTYAVLAQAPTLRTTAASADTDPSGWGVSLAPLNSSLMNSFDIPANVSGVMILSVEPGAIADEAGLAAGDVITGIDKTPITDMNDFFNAILSDKNSTALLDIYSQGAMRYVPLDSSSIQITDQTQTQDQATLRDRIFSFFSFTGGTPFATDDDEEEEGPKGGKFADDSIALTSDNTAFNRPSAPPGEANAGSSSSSSSSSSDIALNRPSQVPPQTATGPNNDTVLFFGILLIVIVYLAYREFNRPPELSANKKG